MLLVHAGVVSSIRGSDALAEVRTYLNFRLFFVKVTSYSISVMVFQYLDSRDDDVIFTGE